MDEQKVEIGYAIVELMGHRKLAGLVTEVEVAGEGFLRIDVPAADGEGDVATQFLSPRAVYAITPVGEELAREVATAAQPAPVSRWELPGPDPVVEMFEDDDLEP